MVRETFFDLRDVSRTTVRRTMLPPDKGVKAKKYYRGLIKAKPRASVNSKPLGPPHPNTHPCSAIYRMGLELSAKHSKYVDAISCDDKGRIPKNLFLSIFISEGVN